MGTDLVPMDGKNNLGVPIQVSWQNNQGRGNMIIIFMANTVQGVTGLVFVAETVRGLT